MKTHICAVAVTSALLLAAPEAWAGNREAATVDDAADVLSELSLWHVIGDPTLPGTLTQLFFDAIERFGPGRCMFESNFPVDKLSCSYTVLWNSFKRLAARFSATEKAALFHDTAARVYRLAGRESA